MKNRILGASLLLLSSLTQTEGRLRALQSCPNPEDGVFPMVPVYDAACDSAGRILNVDWSDATDFKGWSGNLGARKDVSNGYLKVMNRKAAWQGPIIEIDDSFRNCVKPELGYTFTAKLKLTKSGGATNCGTTGTNCPKLIWQHMNSKEQFRSWDLVTMTQADYAGDDAWSTWTGEIEFKPSYVDTTDVFTALAIVDVETGTEISVESMMMEPPPVTAFPDTSDVCGELLMNGDGASSNGLLFPWKPFIGLDTVELQKDDDGPYFHIESRKYPHSCITQTLPTGCLRPNAVYTLSQTIRHGVDGKTLSWVMIRGFAADGTSPKFQTIGACATNTATQWSTCTKDVKINRDILVNGPFTIIWTTGKVKPPMSWRNLSLKVKDCGDVAVAPTPVGAPASGTLVTIGDAACTREVIVQVDSQADTSTVLSVDDGTAAVDVSSQFDAPDARSATHWYLSRRYYAIKLGAGDYTGAFTLTGSDANAAWPYFAEIVARDAPSCAGYFDSFAITRPDVGSGTCDNMIRNGDFEATGVSDSTSQWYHTGCGLTVEAGLGIGGSNALKTTGRTDTAHGLVQFLDTRCMTSGTRYKISAKFKLLDSATCDPLATSGVTRCLRANIRSMNSGDLSTAAYKFGVGEALEFTADAWNTLEGLFFVNADMIAADNVALYFDGLGTNVEFAIDDVSLVPVDVSNVNCVTNGDFESGNVLGWTKYGSATVIQTIAPGADSTAYALETSGRVNVNMGPVQLLDRACLQADQYYEFNAKVKLIDSATSQTVECNPYQQWTLEDTCATAYINSHQGGMLATAIKIANTVGPYDKDGWNHIYGVFKATSAMLTADNVALFLGKVKSGINEIVDEVSITPINGSTVGVPSCSGNLVRNGDAETQDARFWYIRGQRNYGTITMINPGADGTGHAFHHGAGRSVVNMGMYQYLDKSCFTTVGQTYTVKAKFRLYDDTGTQVECKRWSTCPKFFFQAYDGTGQNLANEAPVSPGADMPADDWGTFEGTFTFTAKHQSRQNLDFFVHNVKAGWRYDLDDVEIVAVV